MTRAWRTAFALLTCATAACIPILGLDDLEPRPTPAQTDSGGDTGTVDAADAGPACTKHAECIEAALGNPARCVKNKCVNVNTTRLCNQAILPTDHKLIDREDTILVAAFMQGASPQLTGAGKAYDLALDELELAGGVLGRTKYHLAVLVCDADSTKVEDGVKHVMNDLQLPVIIAAFGSGNLAKLVAGDVVDAGVFTMNPSFTTDFLKYAPKRGLVWSLLGTAEDVALAYRPVLKHLEQEKLLKPGPDTKVAIIATNGSLDAPMAEILHKGQPVRTDGGMDTSKALEINGKLPDEDPDHFRRFRIDSLEFPKPSTFDQTLKDEKDALIAFAPDVIIALTGPELDSFLVEVDAVLVAKNNPDAGADAGADSGAPKKGPYWILGPSNGELVRAGGQKTELGKYIDPDAVGVDERRARIIGVQYAGALETTQRDLWRERMKIKYKDAAAEGLASENFYDAIYWLAYGIAAAGQDAPVNGESFSSGVRKLYKGSPPVKPGDKETVQRAFTDINQYPKDGTLFVGALGPPDINEPTGTWNSVGASYCYPPYQEPGPTPTYDVRRYLTDGGLSGLKPLTCSN